MSKYTVDWPSMGVIALCLAVALGIGWTQHATIVALCGFGCALAGCTFVVKRAAK